MTTEAEGDAAISQETPGASGAGRSRKDLPLESLEGTHSTYTLISELWPPNLGENKCLFLATTFVEVCHGLPRASCGLVPGAERVGAP